MNIRSTFIYPEFASKYLSLRLFFLFLFYGFWNRSPPEFPHITLPEGSFVKAALSRRCEYHQAMKTLRDDVILGTDFNKFLMVLLHSSSTFWTYCLSWLACRFSLGFSLWWYEKFTNLQVVLPLGVLSVVGSWFNFLTVLYFGQFQLHLFFLLYLISCRTELSHYGCIYDLSMVSMLHVEVISVTW